MEQTSNSTSNSSSVTATVEKKLSASTAHGCKDEVRVIGISEYEEAAECLSQAFATDEVARYFVDTPDMAGRSAEYKWKLHVDILRYVTAAHCCKGIVTTIGPNYNAVALWMPPGKNMDDIFTILRSGMWRLYFKLSRQGWTRFYSEFLPLLHDAKASVLGPHDDHSMYLVYLGTKPGSQGKGYARKLIEHGLGLADQWSVPTYLESSANVNIPYYQKFGFEVKQEIWLKKGAVDKGAQDIGMSVMVREPETGPAAGSLM